MDAVIGVDVHAVAPIPGIPIHPYIGPIFLWSTPVFPSMNVFINGLPACSVGALGYFFHVPQGVPMPPTPTNQPYWKRYFTNIPMVLTLTGLTMLANIAIAGISSLIPKPKSAEKFIQDVTGINTATRAATWQSIKGMFASYTQWQTWAKLLMPPLPYCGAQGSVAVGSPNVTVNGGALAFIGPLLGASCSDIPIVPNAVTLGFSNVLVGVSFADLLRGIAVTAAQRAVQTAVQQGVEAANKEDEPSPEEAAEQNNRCDDGGHPVNQATGAAWSNFKDIDAFGFRLRRELRSTWCHEDGPLGYGMRHDMQYTLRFGVNGAILTDPNNRHFQFQPDQDGRFDSTSFGWVLRQGLDGHFVLRHHSAGTLVFLRSPNHTFGWLRTRTRGRSIETYLYEGRLLTNIRVERKTNFETQLISNIFIAYDQAGRLTGVAGSQSGAEKVILGTYLYDDAGCLATFVDALNGKWHYLYDSANRCVKETNPSGYSFHYKYDLKGRCIYTAGDDGLWRVDLRYAPGRTLMTECDHGLWVYTHNENRTITDITDPYGGRRVRKPGVDGRVLIEVDSGGRIMRNLFDAYGAQTGRLDRWGNRWPTQDEAPKLPNPLARKLPATARAREWGEEPAPSGNVARQLSPGLLAALDAVLPAPSRVKPYERRDLLGRVVSRTDATGATECYAYDSAGNCISLIDADGQEQRQEFASWNLCVTRADAMGRTTQYRHTKREKIASIIDANGAVSKYVYDCKDRLTHVTRHGVLRESYRYDNGDRLIEKLDGDGKTLLTFEVGANGLHSKRILASGEVFRYDYDTTGNVTEASTTKAKVLRRFAGRNRVSDKRDGLGVEHGWAGERLAATTYFDRFTVRYETLGPGDVLIHPPAGRPHRITTDADGSVIRLTGAGTCELSRYDAVGRCTGRARWLRAETSVTAWTAYDYSHAGELRAVRDSRGGETRYSYDAAHRVTGRTGTAGNCVFAYDGAGNLTASPDWPSLIHVEGNRLGRSVDAEFQHNARNHLSTIEYADRRRIRFLYDAMDNLVRVEGSPSCTDWEAERDGLGRRIAKIVDGARTEYFWDGDRLSAEIGPDRKVRLYIYADSNALVPISFVDYASIAAAPSEGAAFCVFHDQIGLPLLVEDAGGRVAWQARAADPYGTIEVAAGALVAYQLRFPGHIFDPETGLNDNRFRSYSSELRRYLQSDPAGQSGGINLYAYSSSPLTSVDVLGLHPGDADTTTNETPGDAQPSHETPNEPTPDPIVEGAAPAIDPNAPASAAAIASVAPGSYDQPNGGRTDIGQQEDHGAGVNHTHDPITNENPVTGQKFINGLQQGSDARPVSNQDIENINNGTATKSAPKGR